MRTLVLLAALFFLSCNSNHIPDKQTHQAIDSLKDTTTPQVTNTPSDVKGSSDFSIQYKGSDISLKDWDHKVGLIKILGKPRSEKIRILGDGADTHTGSAIKTLNYEGLIVELFSPKQNGKQFWVLSMEIYSSAFSTSKNITVGSTLKEMKAAYPGITIAQDGRNDPKNCAYEISRDDNNLRIEVENGIAKQIRFYHEIP